MNTYHKFLIKILVLLLLFFLFDFTLGFFLQKLYFSQSSGLLYRTTYSIEYTQADILVFGNSRANHHYHPLIISNGTENSFYNTGRDGMGIIYHYAILKGILKRHRPKIIILDIGKEQFSKENSEREKISALLPYYKTHPEIRELLYLRGPLEKIKLLSPSYPFNSIIPTILVGNMEFNKDRKKDLMGFIPLAERDTIELTHSIKMLENSEAGNYLIDKSLVFIFEEFIKTCVDNKINLIVITSPYLTNKGINDLSIKITASICVKHNVRYLDYSYFKGISDNLKYFKDPLHLNEQGSKSFSNELVGIIKALIINSKQ